MATFTFHNDLADVQVTPTMEALGDQPWFCTVHPRMQLPVLTVTVEASYPIIAACEAVNAFKEKHNIQQLSGVWSF